MAKVSVLLLTLNEEGSLPACLDALSWCDDVWVVDSYSTDATVTVARAAGAHVVQRSFDTFAAQRNYALRNVDFQHEWVLHLDADEICTPALLDEIKERIECTDFDAYRVPSKTMFMGKWLRYSGMYPTYQVRLGRQPQFRFKQVGHGQREDVDPSRVGTLENPYLHYSFSKGLSEWFEKHNRYSTLEAAEALRSGRYDGLDVAGLFSLRDATRRRRALKQLSYHVPCRPVLRFIYMYVLRGGILDGKAGLQYCQLLSMYEAMIDLKIAELNRKTIGSGALATLRMEPNTPQSVAGAADGVQDVPKAA